MDSSPSAVPPPPRRRSLRTQLTLLVAAVIIVPAVFSGLLLGLGARHTIREEIFRFIGAVSILGAQAIDGELAHYQETLNRYRTRESLTRYIRELSEMPPAARRELLRRRLENQLTVLTHPSARVYRPMLVLSPEGRLLGWSGLSATEAKVRARRYNPEVLRRAGPARLTPAYLEPSRRLVAIDVIAAVEDPASAGRTLAVFIWTHYLPDAVGPILQRARLVGATAEWVLIDQDGRPLLDLHDQPGSALSVKLTSERAMRARSGQRDVLVARDYRDEWVVASSRPITRLDWCLIAKIDLSEAYAGMHRVTAWWALLTMLMIAVGYVLARVTAARIVAPIYALSAAARRMAAGDNQARVSLQRDDELGDLAGDFNHMAGEVFRTREELERLVEARTAELQAAITELQRLNQEMGAFTYSVSHDLAAPLVSLQGLTRILLRDYSDRLDAEGIRRLQRLQANVQMLESLVDDLLELSRVGRIETNPVDLDPAAAVADVVSSLQDTIAASGVEMIAPELGVCPRVRVEPNRLRQILSNLLSNAIKYGVSGSPPRIEITCQGDDARFVRVTVADNGPGIPPEQRGRAFLPFQRLSGSPDTTGTGMGLAIARKIVEHYGGSIQVDESQGGGAAFSFTLPRAEPGNGQE